MTQITHSATLERYLYGVTQNEKGTYYHVYWENAFCNKMKLLYAIILVYLGAMALLYVFQRSLMYLPTPAYPHNYPQMSVQSAGERIEVIILNEGNDKAMIYFGGNAEPVLASAKDFSEQFADTTVYLVNYRGYGGSSGQPKQASLFADAEAVFDHVAPAHQDIAIMGRSLGTGVAMHLGAHRSVSKLILVTPYDCIAAIAKNQFPIFPISLLIKDKFDSISLANKISVPVLFIAGGADTLIPPEHSKRLAQAIDKDYVEWIMIAKAGHNDIQEFNEFYPYIRRFLTRN